MPSAIKGASVLVQLTADGRPLLVLVKCDVPRQHRTGTRLAVIDQPGEPIKIPGVFNLIDAAYLCGRLIIGLTVIFSKTIFIVCNIFIIIGAFWYNNAMGFVKGWVVILAQILPP